MALDIFLKGALPKPLVETLASVGPYGAFGGWLSGTVDILNCTS